MPLAGSRFDSRDDVEAMIAGFHAAHERVFAVSEPGQGIECIYWKARAIARLPKPSLARHRPSSTDAGPVAVRDAWFGGDDPEPTPRHDGPSLREGTVLRGPCVIQEPTTTIVVFPGWGARVLASGDYMLTREVKG